MAEQLFRSRGPGSCLRGTRTRASRRGDPPVHTMPPMSDPPPARLPERDRPWLMRTYAGHSDARRSNELYRRNLAKGQTGLSIAFDLPTQTGYDPDDELAAGEVGRGGNPVAQLGDCRTLFEGIR